MLKKILAGAILALSIFGMASVSEAHCGDYYRGGYCDGYYGGGCCR